MSLKHGKSISYRLIIFISSVRKSFFVFVGCGDEEVAYSSAE